MYRFTRKQALGFTLAELLSALAILGVIATFTIPKVLNASQNGQYNAMAKEVVSMMSGAYAAYRLDNTVNASTNAFSLTPYLNYISLHTDVGTTYDTMYGFADQNCGSGGTTLCLKLHNGGLIRVACNFGPATDMNAIVFTFDPVAGADGNTSGPHEGVEFWLYTTGRVTTRPYIETGSGCNSNYSYGPGGIDPTWFEF